LLIEENRLKVFEIRALRKITELGKLEMMQGCTTKGFITFTLCQI
jgi:hypothetical protein